MSSRGRRSLFGVLPVAAVLVPAAGIAYFGAISYQADRGLVAAKVEEHVQLAWGAARQLEAYSWPGNVRELQHVVERAVLLSRGDSLRLDGILTPPVEPRRTTLQESIGEASIDVIPEVEWRRREQANLRNALKLAQGRIYGPNGAADILGVKPTTLISRLKALGLRHAARRRRSSHVRRPLD